MEKYKKILLLISALLLILAFIIITAILIPKYSDSQNILEIIGKLLSNFSN